MWLSWYDPQLQRRAWMRHRRGPVPLVLGVGSGAAEGDGLGQRRGIEVVLTGERMVVRTASGGRTRERWRRGVDPWRKSEII